MRTRGIAREHRPYEVVEYDPAWPELFKQYAERVRPIFGDNLISIEHMGSTAIHGMVAKPKIDMLAVVRDLNRVPGVYEQFVSAGFKPLGPEYVGIGGDYVVYDAPDGRRLAGIHVFEYGHPEIERQRNFLDYLRTHEEDRELYSSIKRELYARHKNNYEGYDTDKDVLMKPIKERAEEWGRIRKSE